MIAIPDKKPAVPRAGLRRILANLGWLGMERIIRSATALFVTVWVARYLGPERFGLLNYAQSLIAAFLPVATYGLGSVLVRDLVQQPADRGRLLCAALFIRLGGVLLALLLTWGYALGLPRAEPDWLGLVGILSLSYGAVLADGIESDYQADLRNGAVVALKTGCFVVSTLARIGLIQLQAGLLAFAWVIAAESLAIALGFWLLLWSQGRAFRLRWEADGVIRLLRQGGWFFAVALVTALYRRLDQLLLGWLSDAQELGVYAAGWKILEALSYGPVLALSVLAPVLAAAQRESGTALRARFARATRWLFWPLAGVAAVGTLLATWLMPLAFGQGYAGAGGPVQVLLWALPLLALNLLGGQWATLMHRPRYLVEQGLFSLAACVGLGAWLIPDHGARGAAWALLGSLAVATLGFGWCRPVGRDILRLQLGALSGRVR